MGSDSSDSDEDSSETEPLDLTEIDSDSILGTEGDDTLNIDARDGGFASVTLDTGAGDDLLNLSLPGEESERNDDLWQAAEIDAGQGDDTISARILRTHVNGGDGDDVIDIAWSSGSTIDGGEGDDLITIGRVSGDFERVFGGEGNDTLRALHPASAVALFGGAGDDFIEVVGPADIGAAYFTTPLGEEGNDTISYTSLDASMPGDTPNSLYGGADADLFQLHFNEGIYVNTEELEIRQDVIQPDGSYWLPIVNLPDFEPGEDQIEIHADIAGDGYEITSARIEFVPAQFDYQEDSSNLIIRYEHATEPTRDIVINVATLALDWEDITFAGEHQPQVLEPTA